MSSVPAPGASQKILKTFLILAGISLVAGAVHGVWTEHQAQYDAANQAVLSNVNATIASSLTHWTYTEHSIENLTPDVVIEGNAATIVATSRVHINRLWTFDRDDDRPRWMILARSEGGRYFLLTFTLDTTADPDSAHAGWRRLVTGNPALLTAEGAKDWLYRRGLTKEYEQEFHEAPPPRQISG